MSTHRIIVSAKGQVVIPAELRERLSLAKGAPATWNEEGRLVLTPMTERPLDEIMGLLKPRRPASRPCSRGRCLSGSVSANEKKSDDFAVHARQYAPLCPRRHALIGFFEGRQPVAEKVRQMVGQALRQDLPLLMSAELG